MKPRPAPLAAKKNKGPPVVDPAQRRFRARGTLWGLAVGDALGTTFQDKRLAAAPFPTVLEGPQTELRGGGPLELRPGQVSRPTQLACVVAAGLKTLGRYDAGEALKAYRRWHEELPPAGEQLEPLFEAYANGGHRPLVAIHYWVAHRLKAGGNASLIRTAPLGVFFSQNTRARIQSALEDSALTHYDPRCQLACVCLNASIAAALESPTPPAAAHLVTAAMADLNAAAATLARERPEHAVFVQEATEQLKEDLGLAQRPDPELYGPGLHLHTTSDRVRLTLRLAYWELFHAPSTERALIDVINRGGDSSANASVTGALLGAVHGENSIPERWRQTVWDALASVFPRTPLWERYHPRQLLALLEP